MPKKALLPLSFTLPKTTRLDALLSKELPPAHPVISPWLHAGESCLLWAGTGVGKSMVAQTIALAAAGGGKVLGWDFPRPTSVLYVDGEQSERALQSRFGLLRTTIAGHDSKKAAANLVVMARTAQDSPADFLDIANPDHRTAFLSAAKRGRFGLIIFDNLSTLTDSVGDENSAGAMKPMQALLARLKKENSAVIVVHHSGKDPSKGFRGSSNIATTFERILGIRRNETAGFSRIDATVTLEKFRDEIPEGFRPTFPLTFSTSETGGGATAAWVVGDLGQLEEGWRMFAHGAFTTQKEFLEAFNARFGTSKGAGTFKRDFMNAWMTKLGKTQRDIEAAQSRMKFLRRQDTEEEDISTPAAF